MSATETEVRQLADRLDETADDILTLETRMKRSLQFLAALSGGAHGQLSKKVRRIDEGSRAAFAKCDRGFTAVADDISTVQRAFKALLGVNIFNPAELAAVEKASALAVSGVSAIERLASLEAECSAKAETVRELQDELAKARAERDQARSIARNFRDRASVAVPTWTNTKGVSQRVTDMPTPYLENVAGILFQHGLAFGPRGRGLYGAIQDELDKRRQEEAA